jgi:prepilin-type processing-associated H-X9-DG protein
MGVGLHAYVAATNVLPQGNNGRGYSAHCMLLPYLEETTTFHGLNFHFVAANGDTVAPGNLTAFQHKVGIFGCPSDSKASSQQPLNSYAGNRGVGLQRFGFNGAFGLESRGPMTLAAFTDGTSSTAAFSEWMTGGDASRSADDRRLIYQTNQVLSKPPMFEAFIATCTSSDEVTLAPSFGGKGAIWIRGEFRQTLYNHTVVPNGRTCTNGGLIQQGAWTATSLHRQGVNVLFADGRVQFVKDGIGERVWHALGSRDGGETIGSVPSKS